MTTQIQKIHASDMFGIFIEMGLGNPVSSKLCEVPGASNTVFCAENPYNGDYSRNLFGIEGRVVSLEAVRKIMSSDRVNALVLKDSRINTVFVSSFQIGNDDKSTHGYVGIKYKDEVKYYHISIHHPSNRTEYIRLIAETCLNLLTNEDYTHVDGVWDSNLKPLYSDTFHYLNKGNHGLSYIENGNILRLEDLLRSANKGLIIYKGSFNPITNAHLKIMSESSRQYPNYKTCFSISMNTYDKGTPNWDNLKERIRLINKLGNSVLLYQSPLFDSMHKTLQYKYENGKDIVYVMGADTADRYLNNDAALWMENRKFLVFDRDNFEIEKKWEKAVKRQVFKKSIDDSDITFNVLKNEIKWRSYDCVVMRSDFSDSSTQVREAIRNNNLESVREMIPAEIFDDLIGNKLFEQPCTKN
jgi:nicotinic acid mononucleotide adenylyltransferase